MVEKPTGFKRSIEVPEGMVKAALKVKASATIN
jgi:hypothetical protein